MRYNKSALCTINMLTGLMMSTYTNSMKDNHSVLQYSERHIFSYLELDSKEKLRNV